MAILWTSRGIHAESVIHLIYLESFCSRHTRAWLQESTARINTEAHNWTANETRALDSVISPQQHR